MEYTAKTFQERLREDIKGYSLENLMDLDRVEAYLKDLCAVLGIEVLLTQRHGEIAVRIGDFSGFVPDVVNEPGRKIRVQNRTVGHLYAKTDRAADAALAERMLDHVTGLYAGLCENHYLYRETAIYADELEAEREKEEYRAKRGEHEDALTGVLNRTYYESRLKEMEETAPAAVICANINDWKFVYDHFGNEESDRLIRTIALLIRREAQESYVIGRVDGDEFAVVIPNPAEQEAEQFVSRIQNACRLCEDDVLAPSLAVGLVYRTNVEEAFSQCYSDAQYEMFYNKLAIKHEAGYRERLEHGLFAAK